MPLLKNPNTEGRLIPGYGEVAPGATIEVPDAVVADHADGANFVRVDAVDDTPPTLKDTEEKPQKRSRT